MKKRGIVLFGAILNALALVSCGNRLTSTDIVVNEPKKNENLSLATKIDVTIPNTQVGKPKTDNGLLASELDFIYSDDVDGYFNPLAYYYYKNPVLTERHTTFLDARKQISVKYKSLTATKSYEVIKEKQHDFTLAKSVMDFDTGNLFYYQKSYTEEDGKRKDKGSIETRAIRDGEKYIVASTISVVDYDMPTGETITSEVEGIGTVVKSVTKKVTTSKKVYTEMPSKYVVLNTDKYSRQLRVDLKNLINYADYNLLFNIEEKCTRIGTGTTSLNTMSIYADDNWSNLFFESDNYKETHEDYILNGYFKDSGTMKYTYNFELNKDKALGESINISGYKKYDYDITKATYSIFPLAVEPYNIESSVALKEDFLVSVFND